MKKLLNLHFSRKALIMMSGDLFCFAASFLLALCIRFEFALMSPSLLEHLQYFPVIIGPQLCSYVVMNLYAGMWRYTSINSILRLSVAVSVSFLISLFLLNYLWDMGFSRGVLVIDAMLTILSTTSLRVGVRLFFERQQKVADIQKGKGRLAPEMRRIVIIGAGNGGELIVREMFKTCPSREIPVAILDDDLRKTGRTIHGVQVVGPIDSLPEAVERFAPHEVFICIPSAKGSAMRRIMEVCEACGVKYKTLPGVNELLHEDFGLSNLREVSYDDLLGREPVSLDMDRIKEYLAGKVVLVTGCGGSIGSELCHKILRFEPRQILLLDSGEFNLFSVTSELRTFQSYKQCVPILANLIDAALLGRIFDTYRPQVVFHAAAYKHVPLLEINPWEAVYNNIIASRNLIEMAVAHDVGTFVLVSTDKAVRPTNVMGASKRVTELLLRACMPPAMRGMAVRFGNVIGSSGSVVPFFIKQIKAGKPVTVTHPEVTRYFMTIGEAAQLIIQAGGMGDGGETFLIKMGQSVRIRDMAADLIRLCGKVPDKDVPILFTGLREGEKLYEELITAEENVIPTPHKKLMKLRADLGGSSEKERATLREALFGKLDELIRCADRHDALAIKRVLKEIVPEYTPQDVENYVL